MARIDEFVGQALRNIGPKPPDSAKRAAKKRFSEKLSQALAEAFAAELRERGLDTARPAPPGVLDQSGAERRMSGGIGAKKVDVTWATEESGLLFAISIKTINFRDRRSGNFQKNLTNRRGDMLFEAVTLHRRFPYGVLAGFFILDSEAASDDTDRRNSTFLNAHQRFRLFTGRSDPAGRDEQYERLFIVLLDANRFDPTFDAYTVGVTDKPVPLETVFDELVELVAERDPDFYEAEDGRLKKV
ncbi:MAG: hypothetical protein RJQ04_04105 [Longimicrobiales bacterium]